MAVYDREYVVILHPDIGNGGYWVECSKLDIVSQGYTIEESLYMIKKAMELHFEDTEGIQSNRA